LIAINEAAKRHNIGIIDAECDRDHVHVIAKLSLTMSPDKAAMLLKGISARIILHEVPHVRRLYRGKHLWSPGKFMASVGYITLEKAKKYLEEHHTKKRATINHKESPPRSEAEGTPPTGGGPLGRGAVNSFRTSTRHSFA
jgi:REP element-mobilizing transposase RayT